MRNPLRFWVTTAFLAALVCVDETAAQTSDASKDTAPLSPAAYRPVTYCEEFLESFGINAGPFDIHQPESPFGEGGSHYPPEFLFDLGIRYYRCVLRYDLVNPDQPALVANWRRQTGARPVLLIDQRKSLTVRDPGRGIPEDGNFDALLADLRRYRPGDVAMIEGPNELNNKFPPQVLNMVYKGLTDEAAGAVYQRDLQAALKSHPATSEIPLINFTSIFSEYAQARPCYAFNYNNMHSYQGEAVPSASLFMNITRANNILPPGAPTRPFVPTECGYWVRNDLADGEREYHDTRRTQAYNLPMLFCEYYRCGVYRTLLFALHNVREQEPSLGTGLLESDQATRRPAWFALQSFLALFRDAAWNDETLTWEYPGPPAPIRALPFTLENAPATLHSLVLQHSSGDWFVLVWNELQNIRDSREVAHPEVEVGLAFDPALPLKVVGHWRQGTPPADVYASEEATRSAEFRPTPLPALDDANRLRLSVPSRVVVLRLRVAGVPPAPAPADGQNAPQGQTQRGRDARDTGTAAPPAPVLTGTATENRVELTIEAPGEPAAVLLFRDDRFLAALPVVKGKATYVDATEWIRPGVGYRFTAQSVGQNRTFSERTKLVIATPDRRPDFDLETLEAVVNGVPVPAGTAIEPGTKVRFQGRVKNIGEGASPHAARLSDQPEDMYDVLVGLVVSVDGKVFWGDQDGRTPYKLGEARDVAAAGGPYGAEWTATPGLYVVRGEVDDLRRVFEDNNRNNNFREITVQVGPTAGGRLSMTSSAAPNEMNLTHDGSADWLHVASWDGEKNQSRPVRKQLPADARRLGAPQRLGKAEGTIMTTVGGPLRVSWDEGDAEGDARPRAANGAIWGNGVGNGVRFTAPADQRLRRLRAYTGLIEGAGGRFTARLSDGSAPELVSTGWTANRNGPHFLWAAQPGAISVVYELTYRAATDGQTLEVEWSLENEPNRFLGQFRLSAITLTELPEE